ncbi:hypothetical protein DSBG_4347 [Desulfosporosinus sp. BG]|nr:hypothetical protein DSBG_4347 [Desulfosporosinus sp. BG]
MPYSILLISGTLLALLGNTYIIFILNLVACKIHILAF